MPSLNQNFAHWIGNHLTLQITVKNADGTFPNLAGASASWRMARTPGGPAVLSKVATIVGASPPVLQVPLVPTDTSLLPAGAYYHEAEITDALGQISTVTLGRAVLQPSLFAS